MTTQRLLLGAAWPYASGPRHVGHLAGAYLPADVVARASRLHGDEVLLVSGSDQYGTPITVAAERAGVPPQELAAANHDLIRKTFERAGITFDHYACTSTPTHHRTVHDLFGRLRRRGFIHEESREAAWCPTHRRSLPDRYVEGTCPRCGDGHARGDQCDGCGATLEPVELLGPRCRTCGTTAELRSVPQLVLALDRLHQQVARWLSATSGTWSRPWVAEEASGHLATGLRTRGITRNLRWGVPIPLERWDDHRFYVWFDAVVGYLSATIEWAEQRGEPDGWRRWWLDGEDERTTLRHRYFVGKDNVWFHALWWPAILLGASDAQTPFHLPDDLVASHHLTEAGAQLSTSRGHGTTLDGAFDRWGVDQVRHAVATVAPESADSELRADAVGDATRTGLLGAIANPAHRVTTLWWRRFGDAAAAPAVDERRDAQAALDSIGRLLRAGQLRRGVGEVHAIGRGINQRLAAAEPWRADDAEARDVLGRLLPWVDALALAAWPIVPGTAGRIRTTLGLDREPVRWLLSDQPLRLTTEPARPLTTGAT